MGPSDAVLECACRLHVATLPCCRFAVPPWIERILQLLIRCSCRTHLPLWRCRSFRSNDTGANAVIARNSSSLVLKTSNLKSRNKLDRSPAMHSLSYRWLALCCGLLFAVFSTAQAAHIHREPDLRQKTQIHAPTVSSADTDEAHCPLCSAAQSVLPASQSLPVWQVALLSAAICIAIYRKPRDPWHFARLSRPPPMSLYV